MKRIALAPVAAFVCLAFAPACDGAEKCEPLAKHIVEISSPAFPDADEKAKEKALKDTISACAQDVPEQAVYDCAMAAKTVEELNKCDEKASKKE